jgi:hypothetical protein
VTVVRKQDVQRSCAICHRTLLMGERAVRFTPGGDDWVDVCALCTTTADDHGWIKEGSPTTPIVPEARRRRRFAGLASLLETRRAVPEQRVPEPMYRRLGGSRRWWSRQLFNDAPTGGRSQGSRRAWARRVISCALGRQPRGRDASRRTSLVPIPRLARLPAKIRLAERGFEIDDLAPLHAVEQPPRQRRPAPGHPRL